MPSNKDPVGNGFKNRTRVVKGFFNLGGLEARARRLERIHLRLGPIVVEILLFEVRRSNSARIRLSVIEFEVTFVALANVFSIVKCQLSDMVNDGRVLAFIDIEPLSPKESKWW